MRRSAGGVGRLVAGAAGVVLVAGCSSGGSGAGAEQRVVEPPTVEAAAACPGLLNAEAAEAVQRTVQSSAFLRDEGQAVGAVAVGAALEAAYKAGPKVREAAVPACVVTGQVGGGDRKAELRLSADSGRAGRSAPGGEGVRVSTGEGQGVVAFDCVSVRAGSTAEVPLRVTSVFADRRQKPGAEAGPADYLVVAHSAALAVAKELGCANGAGLPAKAADLPPAAPATPSAP